MFSLYTWLVAQNEKSFAYLWENPPEFFNQSQRGNNPIKYQGLEDQCAHARRYGEFYTIMQSRSQSMRLFLLVSTENFLWIRFQCACQSNWAKKLIIPVSRTSVLIKRNAGSGDEIDSNKAYNKGTIHSILFYIVVKRKSSTSPTSTFLLIHITCYSLDYYFFVCWSPDTNISWSHANKKKIHSTWSEMGKYYIHFEKKLQLLD